MKLRTTVLAGAAALALTAAGAGAAIAAPDAHSPVKQYGQPAMTAVTSLTGRPDSGNGGTWATDTLTRTLTLTLAGTEGTGPSEVWEYDATVSDTGSFLTIAGALTPNQSGIYAGLTIGAEADGAMEGGADYSFTASAPASAAANLGVPASESGAPSGDQTTSLWYEQAFPAGTTFGGAGIGDWSWTYSVSADVHLDGLYRVWTDSSANGYGDEPGDGNINV
jgi:hypothetical protein